MESDDGESVVMDNVTIARKLHEYADYLESQEESNVYRVRAYRTAAQTILAQPRPLTDLLADQGRSGLHSLPGIGLSLAFTLEGLIRTGEFHTLRPDDGHIDPERLLTSLPGVGPQLARTLHERLGITTLEELEKAAHDGRLAMVGVGPKRLRGLIDALAGRLQRSRLPGPVRGEPAVAEILAVDAEYRDQALQSNLPTIAPRRFNPGHEPWLPLYAAERAGWHYRAFYSNTALAHRLGRTNDWVVVHFEDGCHTGQRTVVTETRGVLRGRRVVRGRERECREHYRPQTVESAAVPADDIAGKDRHHTVETGAPRFAG
jgi:hypothetical protein